MDARDIDWRRYDQLKAQGRSGRQIAQALGVAESTLRGALKRRQTPRALPVQRPVQTTDTGAVQIFDTGVVQRIDRLEDELHGLHQLVQSVIERLDQLPV